MLGMTIHRITAIKEVATILNNSGHCISYNDIGLLEHHWVNLSSTKKEIFNGVIKGYPTHFDNNDACQETMTGLATTHHINSLIFQPLTSGKNSCKKKITVLSLKTLIRACKMMTGDTRHVVVVSFLIKLNTLLSFPILLFLLMKHNRS